jgi:hypothetical protein
MTIKRILAVSAVLASAALLPDSAAAQWLGPSIEATAGLGAGGGGRYVERGGATLDALLTAPIGTTSSGTFVVGVTAAANGKFTSELVCVGQPNGDCIGEYPAFLSLGAVAGVQRRLGDNLTARVLAGPAYFQAVDGEDTFGAQARVDVARRVVPHTWLVASLRGSVLPDYAGENLRFGGLGLGVRIQ